MKAERANYRRKHRKKQSPFEAPHGSRKGFDREIHLSPAWPQTPVEYMPPNRWGDIEDFKEKPGGLKGWKKRGKKPLWIITLG